MASNLKKSRAEWVAWLRSYGGGQLFDAIIESCQGAESTCVHCKEKIYFDIVEGGGVPDWGSAIPGITGKRGAGLDYGCADSPYSDSEGTGPHEPKKLSW